MAAGKAIVAADATSNPELIIDGLTGLLVPSGEPASYAKALRSLLDDRELAVGLGEAARRHQQPFFTEAGMLGDVREAILDR